MRALVLLLAAFVLFSSVLSKRTRFDEYDFYSAFHDDYFEEKSNFVIKLLFRYVSEINSTACESDLLALQRDLLNGKIEAIMAFTSSGTISSGLVDLYIAGHGDFEVCRQNPSFHYLQANVIPPVPLNISGDMPAEFAKYIEGMEKPGKYVKDISYQLGLCLPKSCEANALQRAIDRGFYNQTKIYVKISGAPSEASRHCYKRIEKFVLFFFSTLLSILLIATLITNEYIINQGSRYRYKFDLTNQKLIEAFALDRNAKQTHQIKNRFLSIEAFRGVFLFLVFFVHFASSIMEPKMAMYMKRPQISARRYYHDFKPLKIDATMDGFYCIIAITMMYTFRTPSSFLSGLRKQFLRRYFQFFFAVLGLLFFELMVFAVLNSPIFHDHRKSSWWPKDVFLYVFFLSNYPKIWSQDSGTSGIMSWFLATDLQLQPFAYTYCYFPIKSPKKAFKWGLLIGSIFLFANTYPFFLYEVTLAQKSNAAGDLDAVNGLNYLAHYHRAPNQRVPTYIVGILAGYALKRNWSLNGKYRKLTAWVAIAILGVAVNVCDCNWDTEHFQTVTEVEKFLSVLLKRVTNVSLFAILVSLLIKFETKSTSEGSASAWTKFCFLFGEVGLAFYLQHMTVIRYVFFQFNSDFRVLADYDFFSHYILVFSAALFVAYLFTLAFVKPVFNLIPRFIK